MKKWYQSKGCKGILIGAMHVAIVIIATIVLEFFAHSRSMDISLFLSYLTGKQYEDTIRFEEEVWWLSYEKATLSRNEPYFDGDALKGRVLDITYLPDTMAEIERISLSTEEISGEVKEGADEENINIASGVFYHIEDLMEWAQFEWMPEYYDTNQPENMIVVCQDATGKYTYYYYDEFEKLVQDKQLRLVSEIEGEEKTKDILQEMQAWNYDELEYLSPISVLDEQEDLKYESCWTMGTFNERFLTVDGRSLLDIAMNENQWNGRLRELIRNLEATLETIYREQNYYHYAKLSAEEEKVNNFSYVFVDLKNKQVNSNVAEYTDFQKYEEYVAQLEGAGKYVKVELRDKMVQTNLVSGVENWEGDFHTFLDEDHIFVASMNMPLSVQDAIYEQKAAYESLPSSKALIAMSVTFVVSLVWLTIVAGRRRDTQEVVLHKFDYMKSELACALIIAVGAAFAFIMFLIIDHYTAIYYSNQRNLNTLGKILVFGMCAIGLTGYLSLVRRIKAKTLWKNSILKWFWERVWRLGGFAQEVFRNRKSTTKVIVIFGGMLALTFIAVASYSAGIMSLVFLVACVLFIRALKTAIAVQKIREGLKAIVEGNLDYQIPVEKMAGDQKEIAERINSIREGLECAIEKSIKDERMKTELITNVSHDIKTPLTSIINYVDLLKRENFQDTKIQGYLKVLEEKAQRLKTLTEGVVEASKVTSGNIQLEFTVVNLVEMIQQSEGEFEQSFKERNLQLVMHYPKEPALVSVDGKYMWRVLENLFSNVAKYAMEGTRVYGELQADEKGTIFSMKNVSATQLNITAEELTERFIRGDESRSTEGNGLGLSIAKSLVELQGGEMSLVIDGDLFKVTVVFSKK